MSRVVVVGSTMIEQLTYAQKLPGPGETLVGTRCAMGYGGKGANQAVMARNLGGEGAVAMVNCLGDPSVDHYAKLYKSRFEELGINVDHIHFSKKGTMTGIAPVWVEASGQNRILVVPGANDELMPEQAATVARLPERAAARMSLRINQVLLLRRTRTNRLRLDRKGYGKYS